MFNHRLLVILVIRAIENDLDLSHDSGRGGEIVLEVHGVYGVSNNKVMRAMTGRVMTR